MMQKMLLIFDAEQIPFLYFAKFTPRFRSQNFLKLWNIRLSVETSYYSFR